MNIRYVGLFVDLNELLEKIEKIPNAHRLAKIIENPHVTIDYFSEPRTNELESEVGRIVDIKVVGYANDESNEGILVELIKPGDKLGAAAAKVKVLHITVSIAEGARPVNTGMLQFEPLDEPFMVSGVFGEFRDGDQHPYCGALSEVFVGKYIVPFAISSEKNGRARTVTDSNWKPKPIKIRYLAKYIEEVFLSKNGIMNAYSLSEDTEDELLKGYRGRYYYIRNRESGADEKIRLFDVEIYCFATGICFLAISIGADISASDATILELSSKMAYFFRLDKISKSDRNENEIELAKRILKIVESSVGKSIEWFPSTENKKCNAFMRCPRKSESDGDYRFAYRLSRGFSMRNYVSDNVKKEVTGGDMEFVDDRFWVVDSNGIVVITYPNKNSNRNFMCNIFPGNVDRNYFAEYLLALHERESFLIYNTRAVRNWDNMKELVKLKGEILKLDIWSTYNAVSTDPYYQELYDKLYVALRLEQLETDVEEVVSKAKDYDDGIKEKRTNNMLTAIGVLAIFSALIDGTDFVNKFSLLADENVWGAGHVAVYIIVFVVIILSIKALIDKK